MTQSKIPRRGQELLNLLIHQYLEEGMPIGSKKLAQERNINLSPATIRNIMAELEAEGFLASPHTSAGRVPTQQGLRFFVDCLLTTQVKSPKELDNLVLPIVESGRGSLAGTERLLDSAANLLSDITQLVSVVSLPNIQQQVLRQVEFVPLSDKRLLVILVLNEQDVQNRIIQLDKNYSKNELIQISNYLNTIFAGKELFEIRQALVEVLKTQRAQLDSLMKSTIEIAEVALQENQKDDFVVTGKENLFSIAEFSDQQQLRQLFEAFYQKSEILGLLDNCIKATGVQIFIGEEGGVEAMNACGLVTAPYTFNNQIVGVLGVIGPTRMPYERVISAVDVTAKILSQALNSTE